MLNKKTSSKKNRIYTLSGLKTPAIRRYKNIVGASLVVMVMAAVGVYAVHSKDSAVKAAPLLPNGFAVKDLPTGQDELLTDFSFAPDNSYFTTSKNGRVAWVSADGVPKTLATLPVYAVDDLGLTGVAVAHDYATSKTLYTVRALEAAGQKVMRLSAWTVSGSPAPTGITNERTIVQLPVGMAVHGMTTVLAPSDGTLWLSIGDNSDFRIADPQALRALDVNQGYGKILHLLPNGNGVASNPFYDSASPNSWKSRVFASGFRSPFRFSLDPATGAPIVGDVGWNSFEEINIVRPGASYGWPCWEGSIQTPGYKDMAACKSVANNKPLWDYPRGPMGTSVTGGVVYTGTSYPVEYRGAYFFGDYSAQRVYTLRYDANGTLTRAPESGGFGVENGFPVKFASASNGDILYANIGGSTIKRLVYTTTNRPPVAKAVATTNPATRTVSFDGSQSTDLDGDNLTYSWNFGDGTSGAGVTTTHTYAAPGTTPLTAVLTVSDAFGATGTTSFTVVPANHSPQLTLTTPAAGTLFKAGQTIELSASASDAEDGNLTVEWQVVLVHCSGGYCHNHPGESTTGPTFSRVFDDHGDDTSLEITAKAKDTNGVVAQKTYIAAPLLRTITVNSNVPSAVTINGTARTTAQVTVGATVSLIAPATASDGVATFDRWSDGVTTRERTITMPDADTAYNAMYLTPIERRYNSDAALRTTMGAPANPEQGDATLRYRDYQTGRLYWTPRSGVKYVVGSIFWKYVGLGGHTVFGEPLTDELPVGDGVGRYNEFVGAGWTGLVSIYWTSSLGANEVHGEIGRLWRSLGGVKSPHKYPTSDEVATSNGRGRYNNFQNGAIYWTPATGAKSVYGAIYGKWSQLSKENGVLGFPTTNEATTADGLGRYNNFEGGSVYWSKTGTFAVTGPIRDRWNTLGGVRSYLGYPTSDEFAISGGKRSNFQNGYITYNTTTKVVTDRRY